MQSRVAFALAAILMLFATGCRSSGRSFGANLLNTCVSALLDTDDEEKRPESRRAWYEATNGQWDGVTRDPD